MNPASGMADLSPEERWRQHDMAVQVILDLEQRRLARDGHAFFNCSGGL